MGFIEEVVKNDTAHTNLKTARTQERLERKRRRRQKLLAGGGGEPTAPDGGGAPEMPIESGPEFMTSEEYFAAEPELGTEFDTGSFDAAE